MVFFFSAKGGKFDYGEISFEMGCEETMFLFLVLLFFVITLQIVMFQRSKIEVLFFGPFPRLFLVLYDCFDSERRDKIVVYCHCNSVTAHATQIFLFSQIRIKFLHFIM